MSTITHPLDFERPLVELEMELDRLKDELATGDRSKMADYEKLEAKLAKLRKDVYGNLTAYQRVQLSRHFDRPFTLDYIKYLFEDFIEFHGDRAFRDDAAIVGGTARLGETPVMVVGHQRGRTTQERLKRNFGMPNPEGYRKALRLFHMAEKFKLPLINFIDTQGAYPGIEAEERGQAEAIATNLLALCELTVPIICIVIGEGGSGGALALGIGDKILMMENACYSVISPEGCASILFNKEKDFGTKNYAAIAADLLKPTATDLLKNSIIDEIIPEPMGGAHTNHKEAAELMRPFLIRSIDELSKLVVQDLVDRRYKKFRAMGPFTDH
jgi:acetyl-CoA carboxylase carboxyl transferase subunit alpha